MLRASYIALRTQWRSSHENEVRLFPQRIARPDEDNTTPAAYNLYQTRLNEVTLFRDDQRRLKDIMIGSLGEDVAVMLRDPAKGFANLDPADILFKLKEQFGDLSEVDILTIKIKLKMKSYRQKCCQLCPQGYITSSEHT